MRKQEKERAEEEERKEKALYAAPLPDGVIIPSENAGARDAIFRLKVKHFCQEIRFYVLYIDVMSMEKDLKQYIEKCSAWKLRWQPTGQIAICRVDSVDVIFGKKAIDDNHLLLSEDEQLWEALSRGRCWKEVGDIMLGERRRKGRIYLPNREKT